MRRDVVERIRQLETANGELYARRVLEDAKRKDSPLHIGAGYVWDVREAAELQWLEHSRKLIRDVRVVVVVEEREVRVPAYVRNPGKGDNEEGYISTRVLQRRAASTKKAAVLYELRMAEAHYRRAKNLAEGLGLEATFNELLAQARQAAELVDAASD